MAYDISISGESDDIFMMANRIAWEFIPLAAAQVPDDQEFAEKLEVSTYFHGISLDKRLINDREYAIKAAVAFRKAAALLAEGGDLPSDIIEFEHLKKEGIREHFAKLLPLLDRFLSEASAH